MRQNDALNAGDNLSLRHLTGYFALASLFALATAEQAPAQVAVNLLDEGVAGAVRNRGGHISTIPTLAPVLPTNTAITPDLDPGRRLDTSVSQTGNVYTIDGGRVGGTNLFHSFANFDLASSDTARWVHSAGNPAGLTNVINRVTGGSPSSLFGTIDSTAIPNANFYFINPAGIVFGTGAIVNVPAVAQFSTASELGFEAGPAFQVATPDGSTLSVATPQAFGFVGDEGAILVAAVDNGLMANPGQLNLTASYVTIDESRISTGGLAVAAVGFTPADVGLDGSTIDPLSGHLTIVNSSVEALNGTTLKFNGGYIQITNDSFISTGNFSPDDPFRVAGSISLRAANSILVEGSTIAAYASSLGSSGSIDVNAPSIRVIQSLIGSVSRGSGDAGIVSLSGSDLYVEGSILTTSLGATGKTGGVFVDAVGSMIIFGSLIASDDGFISLTADNSLLILDSEVEAILSQAGDGSAGVIQIGATEVEIALSDVTVENRSSSPSLGGQIGITGSSSVLIQGSQITATSIGVGSAGSISINAPFIRVSFGSEINSNGLALQGNPNAGQISLSGGEVELDGAKLVTFIEGGGSGGGVFIDATGSIEMVDSFIVANRGQILIEADEDITMDSSAIGTADDTPDFSTVTVTADGLRMVNGSSITSSTFGTGDAGTVDIGATLIAMDNSNIASQAVGSTGNAGVITVSGDELRLANNSEISSSTLGAGDAGTVDISVALIAIDGSSINSQAEGDNSGNAGVVMVTGDDLELTNFSQISSSTFGAGDAGGVRIQVQEVSVIDGSNISSQSNPQNGRASPAGNAGSVEISGRSLLVGDGGFIDTSTFGSGAAGRLLIDVDQVTVRGAQTSVASRTFGSRDAGLVEISSDTLVIEDGARVTSQTFGSGNAGNVTIVADTSIVLDNGARLTSDATSDSFGRSATGRGGLIEISTGSITVLGGSQVTTSSINANPAGAISVTAESLTLSGSGSEISSRNTSQAGGSAGAITLRTGDTTISDGGLITTDSDRGPAGVIAIEMTPGSILLLEGRERRGQITTSSGPGTGGEIVISGPLAIILDGGRIEALTRQGNAIASLRYDYFIPSADRLNEIAVEGDLFFGNAIFDVSAGTVTPDLSVIDASGVLRGRCPASRFSGQLSHINLRPIGPASLGVVAPRLPAYMLSFDRRECP